VTCSFRLAGADGQGEPAFRHHADRCRCLRDDRAGESRRDADPRGRLRDTAEHAPRERGMALRFEPGMEMVRDRNEVEARGLRGKSILYQRSRPVLLGHQFVSELHHPILHQRGLNAEDWQSIPSRPSSTHPGSPAVVEERAATTGDIDRHASHAPDQNRQQARSTQADAICDIRWDRTRWI